MWCCEFGAWDGINSSNTFALVEKYNCSAVYIEKNQKKFKKLFKTAEKFSSIIPINSFVDRYKSSENSLDNILGKTKIPKDFDILSIDIDSYDLDVWESLINYEPKIVIIEINSSILPGILQKHGPTKQGSSFTSTVNAAKNKGYELVCHTGNCIFVKKKFVNLLEINNTFFENPELLFERSWLLKNNNFILNFLKKFIPDFLLAFLKIFKKKLFK